MPTSSEKIVNRPLTGTELKSYLTSVCERLLAAEGMLAEHIAYGRVSGSIKLTLKLENSYFPESVTTIKFNKDAPPPAGTKIQEIQHETEKTASFEMDNPNAERVRLGLPVPVETKQLDGTKQIEHIHYPADQVEDLPKQKVKVI